MGWLFRNEKRKQAATNKLPTTATGSPKSARYKYSELSRFMLVKMYEGQWAIT